MSVAEDQNLITYLTLFYFILHLASDKNFQAFKRHSFFSIVTIFGNVGYLSKQFVHDQGDSILSGTESSSLGISELGEIR